MALAIPDHGFPWAVLLVNYVGTVLLAALLIYLNFHEAPKWWWRPGLGAGFCGGFTTYSAFAVKMDQYLNDGKTAAAFSYALASLFGSYLLVLATNELLQKKWAKR